MTAYNISQVRSRESHGAFASHGDCQQAARGQLRAVVIRQGHFHPQHCGHCGDTIGDRDLHAVLCSRRAIVHVLQSISSDVLVGESVAFPKKKCTSQEDRSEHQSNSNGGRPQFSKSLNHVLTWHLMPNLLSCELRRHLLRT